MLLRATRLPSFRSSLLLPRLSSRRFCSWFSLSLLLCSEVPWGAEEDAASLSCSRHQMLLLLLARMPQAALSKPHQLCRPCCCLQCGTGEADLGC